MSIDTSLSDLIFRSAEHPGALPDFIICAGRSPLRLMLLRPQPSPVDGQKFRKQLTLTYSLAPMTTSLNFLPHFPLIDAESLKTESNL